METAPQQRPPARPVGQGRPDQGTPPGGRIVPHDIWAEASVLGAMILDSTAMDVAVQMLRGDYFHRPAHEIIYESLLKMQEESQQVDLVTLAELLERTGQLDAVGGKTYLVDLAGGVPGTANIEHYCSIVRSKAVLRQLIRASQEIAQDAYDSADPAEEVIDRAETKVFQIAQQQITGEAVGLKGLLTETFEKLELHEGKAITGLSSGYPSLDEFTAGFQRGEMIIIAARPSMGKTALLLNIAEYMSVVDSRPIAFFSLEMSRQQIAQRLLASHAQFDLRSMRTRGLSPEDWTQLQTAAGSLSEAKFFIDDSAMLTSLQLRAKARRLQAKEDIQCVFVDYLQLMIGSGRMDKRYEVVGEISRNLKALARELNVPVVCAAQLNRGPTDRPTHKPRMSDLRESGSIEQDADVVALLHNEDYYHKAEPDYPRTGLTQLILEKQRNGPTGVVNLQFRPAYTRFDQAAPGYVHEE